MAQLITAPTKIQAAGEKLKLIEEYAGLVNTRTSLYSVALMNSPAGWSEPGQTPEFDEVSIVLNERDTLSMRRLCEYICTTSSGPRRHAAAQSMPLARAWMHRSSS